DVNADGVINCTDVSMIQKSVVGTITLTADQKFRADVDGNGIVQSYDASLILQKYNLSCD
ncbi:dockerin type I repeat-containing protein, partial [Patescibacteria group bacterium]|nr:dockerin type I repeat-containing protein [Patescibacteria group bacterium]